MFSRATECERKLENENDVNLGWTEKTKSIWPFLCCYWKWTVDSDVIGDCSVVMFGIKKGKWIENCNEMFLKKERKNCEETHDIFRLEKEKSFVCNENYLGVV